MYNDIHNIKELDQIYKKNDQEIFQLQKENEEISEQLKDLEFQINHLDHNIKFKNQQIHGFENQIQEQQFDISQEQSIQKQNENKSQKQLKQQIKNDLERYLKLHYKQQKKDYLDRKLQQENLVKLELNSVAVYFFKGQNPTYSRYAEFKKKQFKPLVQTFSISKITTLKQIQEEANDIWKDEINEVKQLKKQKNLKFQLYDVNMVCLDLVLNQTVEQFFILNKDQQQYATLALMAKNTRQEQILDRQAQAIKIAGENQINNQRIDPEVQQMRNLHNLFQKFVKFMPGLVKYQKNRGSQENLGRQKKLSFLKILFKLIINFSNVLIILITLFRQRNFQFLTEIKVKFSDEFNFNDQLHQDQIYSQILADLYQIEISDDGESQYLRYYDRQYIGKIRVLQSRVKENECLIDIDDQEQEFKCSYIKYTDETKFKKNDDEYDFNIYRDKEYTKIHQVDSYVNSDFDGSGYVFDINPYQTKEQLQEEIDVLVDQDWINYQTSLIVVAINLYDINRNQFQLLELILQVTKNGMVIDDFQFYLLRIYESSNSEFKALFQLDIVNFILIIFSSLLSIVTELIQTIKDLRKKKRQSNARLLKENQQQDYVIEENQGIQLQIQSEQLQQLTLQSQSSSQRSRSQSNYQYRIKNQKQKPFKYRDNIQQFITFNLFFNIFAIYVAFEIFSMYQKPSESIEEIKQTDKYVDLLSYGKKQEISLKFKAFLFVIMATQLVQNFQLIDRVLLMSSILKNAYRALLMILVFLFIVILGYSSVYQYIFGPLVEEFASFQKSFISFSLMYFFGDYKIRNKMEEAQESESFKLVTFITLITVFFGIVSIFHAIMHENYRLLENNTKIYKQSRALKKQIKQKIYENCTCLFQDKNKKKKNKYIQRKKQLKQNMNTNSYIHRKTNMNV